MLRTAVFYGLLGALVFVAYHTFSPTPTYNRRLTDMTISPQGWHSRASAYPYSFIPKRSSLRLGALRNAPVDPEGFTLALFDSPANLAVDAAGKVLVVGDDDFQALLSLADRTKDLPDTGTFRNTWVILQPTTSQPIERVLLPVHEHGEMVFKETSVQGYDGVTTQLKKPVGDIQHIPPTLNELIGLVLEARESADGERDEAMINRVKAILGDVF